MRIAALYYYEDNCQSCIAQARRLASAAEAYDTDKVAFQALPASDDSFDTLRPYLSGLEMPVLVLYNYDTTDIEKGILKKVPEASFVTPTTLRDYLEEIGVERQYRVVADVVFDNFEGWKRRPIRAVYVIGAFLFLIAAGYLVWRFQKDIFKKKRKK